MGRRRTTWDTPDQITECLNCPFDDCIDCIGHGLTPWRILEAKAMDAKGGSFSTRKTRPKFVEAWRDTSSDAELAMLLALTLSTVRKYRHDYHLPPACSLTAEARVIVAEKGLKDSA